MLYIIFTYSFSVFPGLAYLFHFISLSFVICVRYSFRFRYRDVEDLAVRV